MARYRNEPWFLRTEEDATNQRGIVLVVREGCPFTTHRPVLDYSVRVEVKAGVELLEKRAEVEEVG